MHCWPRGAYFDRSESRAPIGGRRYPKREKYLKEEVVRCGLADIIIRAERSCMNTAEGQVFGIMLHWSQICPFQVKSYKQNLTIMTHRDNIEVNITEDFEELKTLKNSRLCKLQPSQKLGKTPLETPHNYSRCSYLRSERKDDESGYRFRYQHSKVRMCSEVWR